MMQPGQIIELPKPDKRYRVGNIAKDKHGELRGHPLTVTPRHMDMLTTLQSDFLSMQLQPPVVISRELGELLKGESDD